MKNHGLAPSDLGVEAPNLCSPVWATIRSSVDLSEIDGDGGDNVAEKIDHSPISTRLLHRVLDDLLLWEGEVVMIEL
ncbi:hypothetical protein FNV43_RR21375 [Rhamnella rubrinervis]|uniref:Uncharacterized protein n=1 Tax=Rhamnella rubrinervis TaxID=2594499 RepID=A0A8K0GRD6_9ROSA|nr:hypothetical protein FNV43_RR21375 [Rhamnella rubrinervis]